jgi:hypothetical protein
MDVIQYIDLVQNGGFIGLLIILAVPKLRNKIFGNGNGYQEQINELKKHARIANDEMGQVNRRLDKIELNVEFIKEILEKK